MPREIAVGLIEPVALENNTGAIEFFAVYLQCTVYNKRCVCVQVYFCSFFDSEGSIGVYLQSPSIT